MKQMEKEKKQTKNQEDEKCLEEKKQLAAVIIERLEKEYPDAG